MVAKDGKGRLQARETPKTRPANFSLESLKIQRAWVEERRSRATRDIVAGEGEDVQKYGEAEADAKGSISLQMSTWAGGRNVEGERTGRGFSLRAKEVVARLGFGFGFGSHCKTSVRV